MSKKAKPVELFHSPSISCAEEFENLISSRGFPAIIRGVDIGSCVSKWSVEYLSCVNPEKKVKVHRSKSPQLDFRTKNFAYETVTFHELVGRCAGVSEQVKVTESSGVCLKEDKTYWYLRSLGDDPRGKDVSDLSIHFPELYPDIRIPQYFSEKSFFSSVFRITSPKLQLWTHYDTCDNILIQIRGRKRIVFFPPKDALNLYLDGDKSVVIDIDSPDFNLYPDFEKVDKYEGFLEEGDIVYIPALWFHNVTALDFSISVNVFWKNLGLELYDKKDTYGNRDLIPAQLAFKTFEKATSQLKLLPGNFEDFYLRRMIISIQKRLETINQGGKGSELGEGE